MTKFFNYEPWTKQSVQSHEHVTIAFHDDGTLSMRTVDKTKSVSTQWCAIGTYGRSPVYGSWIRLTTDSWQTSLFATKMQDQGAKVLTPFIAATCGEIIEQDSNGIVTNPESIRGRIRNRSKHGKRGAGFGMRATTDVNAMRAAVKEAQLKRCIAKNGKCICEA